MKSLAQLNTYSALPVAYDDEGTGAQTLADRYQINGLIDTAQPVMKNIEKIASAAGSWLTYDIHDGKWGVVINNSGTSVASFNDTNILGSITVSGTGLTDLYNSVKVEFPHRELKDSADFVTIDIPGSDLNANEETNALNLVYDIINEPVQAQLLGFIELKQSRIDLVIQFQSDYSNINLKAGEIIDVTNSRFGFTSKLFRIQSITEAQDDEGALRVGITALEYDPNVYSTADLFRYTRTNQNGIITIGSIGKPSTPQISKFEQDARPRIVVETLAPTGVVEGMEFWITSDVNVPSDANRSYSLIATVRPVKPEDKGVFPSGAEVTTEVTAISPGDFFIKARGFNSVVVGQFSDPSGLIEYVPVQTTQAIDDNTGIFDNTGALVTALGASFLINKVSDLLLGSVSSGSIFSSIFDLFKEETGVDLVGQASSGTLVVAADIAIQDEGTTISSPTSAINFVGAGVVANGSGLVTVTIGGGSTGTNAIAITGISPATGPTVGGTSVTIAGINLTGASSVTFDGLTATNITVNASGTNVTCLSPANAVGGADVVVTTPLGNTTFSQGFTYFEQFEFLTRVGTLPPDRTTGIDPVNGFSSDLAPINGSYFIQYGNQTFYGPLIAGTGNARLYKSDGTLVQTVSASSFIFNVNYVEIPFSARTLGTDYYILLDQGAIKYCDKINPAITSGGGWNFNTPLYETTPYTVSTGTLTSSTVTVPTPVSITPSGTGTSKTSTLSITFNQAIKKGSGNFYVRDYVSDATVATAAASGGTVTGSRISFPVSLASAVQDGGRYYVAADAGAVTSLNVDCYAIGQPNAAIVKADGFEFTILGALVLVDFTVNSNPLTDTTKTKVNPQSNIVLNFNRNIQFGTAGTFRIIDTGGNVHQVFDITATFQEDKINELISISGNTVTLNPTTDFVLGRTYYVTGTAASVRDSAGNTWGGVSSANTVRFTVDPGPAPVISPINNTSANVEMNFDRDIEPGSGTIKVYDSNNTLVAELESDDPSISYS
jgi:hypothetical protein